MKKFFKVVGVLACVAAASVVVNHVLQKKDITRDFLTGEDGDDYTEDDECCDEVERPSVMPEKSDTGEDMEKELTKPGKEIARCFL